MLPLSVKSDKSILVDRQKLPLLGLCCILFQFYFASMFLVVPSLKILLNQGFAPWSLEDIYNTHNPFCRLQGDSFSSQVVWNYR